MVISITETPFFRTIFLGSTHCYKTVVFVIKKTSFNPSLFIIIHNTKENLKDVLSEILQLIFLTYKGITLI